MTMMGEHHHSFSIIFYSVLGSLLVVASAAEGDFNCFANDEYNQFFEPVDSEPTCCQNDVCGIPCPVDVPPPSKGFGIAVGIGIAISFLVGMATLFLIKGEPENFFVAGRSLPLWVVSLTLGAQSIDSNALLGNADLSYKYHFYDGAVLPIGLGLSLILNGLFLARFINAENNILTLPDIFAKNYGKVPEVLVSVCTLVSFMMLLAGNLVGMGVILSYLWGIKESNGIWLAAAVVWVYTVSGGLFSVAYTDVVQGMIGWTGCIVFAYYMIANADYSAAPPSIGLPGYIYPDNIGDGGVCDMYKGVECNYTAGACCYNVDEWCDENGENCLADNGAYPIGDQPVFSDQMVNYLSLTPFPNAIFWNWATIFILAFGNLAALDFQARCMAAKTPKIATYGCLIGGLFTFFVGIPFSYMGAITRVHYGPDSIHAEFVADTCSTILGLPTCGAWAPDPLAFLKLSTNQAPAFIGGWCLFGIVCASMSTADGAILAMGTVFSQNFMRQMDNVYPDFITSTNLLHAARLCTIPCCLASALIAAYYQSDNPAGATGYLLIVAFDIVLATVVVPLFGCYYTKHPRPTAAFLSIIAGATCRIVMEFALPKDGYLLLPYQVPEFLDYGPAASTLYPTWIDANSTEVWNPDEEVCDQPQYIDFTGVDSLSSFLLSFLVFVTVQWIENKTEKPIITFPGMNPYQWEVDEAVKGRPGIIDSVQHSSRSFKSDTYDTSRKSLNQSGHSGVDVSTKKGSAEPKAEIELPKEDNDSSEKRSEHEA